MEGESTGGSGFVAGVPISTEPGPLGTFFHIYAYYVVTNAHVVENGASYARLMTEGKPQILSVPEGDWWSHPEGDDLAVFPLEVTDQRYACIPWNDFIGSPNAVQPGDDVFFIGRYVNVEGREYNAPVARFGHVAMLATEKIETGRNRQLSYLVEALSLSGFSGSPVLVFRMHLEHRFDGSIGVSIGSPQETNFITAGTPGEPSLLGVDWGHFRDHQRVMDSGGQLLPGGQYVAGNSGIAGVVPAWRLTELLQLEALSDIRAQQKTEIEEGREKVAPHPAEHNEDSPAN